MTMMMNQRIGNHNNKPLHPQHYMKKKTKELQGSQSESKTMVDNSRSSRDRKLALLQDVDNLKKKLRHEENVRGALERAMDRPLGALPRLPPYLPQYTLELLAEVAVLEEEVVRLEEQVVSFRQGLYEEAVHISSRRSPDDNSTTNKLSMTSSKHSKHSRSSSQSELNLGSSVARPSPSLSRCASSRRFLPAHHIVSERLTNGKEPKNEPCSSALESGLGKENQSSLNSYKNKRTPENKLPVISMPVKNRPLKPEFVAKNVNTLKMQSRIVEQAHERSSSCSSDDRAIDIDGEANIMSENILKCLIKIFVRLSSSSKGKTMDLESFSSSLAESDFRDPYSIFTESSKRDIGAYKHLYSIEACSIDVKRKSNASFLIRKLKILLVKLATVKLDGLSHQQKLAFWINIYNSCIMNAFLEHGIPETPDMILIQMQKATINVGGNVLNALMIEHLILRLPYHLKYTCPKAAKNGEGKVCRTLGLEWSEPLVTFALSCGSRSSPAVRVYTASQIETELEIAKRDYLQATVGISATTNKLIIPKLLDWYLLDFAKDLDALLDWLCLQLPDELRNDAVKCLESKGKEEPISKFVQVMPYNFGFRYLACR